MYQYVGLLTGYHCVFKHMRIREMSRLKIQITKYTLHTDSHITFKYAYSELTQLKIKKKKKSKMTTKKRNYLII